ncbi:MAG: cysteine desulfurase family protein [Sandaracinaceae bacterium]
MNEFLYFDHNATTPLHPEVRAQMIEAMDDGWGNPSSTHAVGRRARAIVDRAREEVAQLIGARPEEMTFTSGGTEANNLAVIGGLAARGGTLILSPVEHPAVAAPASQIEEEGRGVRRLAMGPDGRVEVPSRLLGVGLVSVMHANNETGVLQPIEALSSLARGAGALMHTDAAQTVGKVPVDVGVLGVDLLTLAGHKLYGPKGVGALYIRNGVMLRPVIRGAGHERGLRPGTENVVGIAGLGAACRVAQAGLAERRARVQSLRDQLEARLTEAVHGLVVHGRDAPRLPNTASVAFPGVRGPALLEALPSLAASTGSACHEGAVTPSGVLTAMGVDEDTALGTVRLSLGSETRAAQVEDAAERLIGAWRALRAP